MWCFMNFIKQILNNRIVKNSITLINGTIIAQIINIIISPLISRLYGPGNFGNYSNIVAIISITSIIATLKYDLAIMDRENDEYIAKNTYYLAMFSNTIISLLIILLGIFLSIFKIFAFSFFDYIIIGLITFFSASNIILNVWLNRSGHYKVIRNNKIIYSVFYAILSVVCGYLGFEYYGLIFSLLFSYIIQFIYIYAFLLVKTDFGQYKFSMVNIKYLAKKYIKFPKFQMPAMLLNSASTQLPVILFTNLISSTVSGWYALTVKIINLPMTIIGQALSDIYFKEASLLKGEQKYERLKEFTYNTYKKLLVIGIIPIGIIIGYGDILFEFVFGSQWYMSGVYAMLLAPWYYMVFVSSPLSHLFVILDKQKSNLILNIVVLVSRILSIIMGIYFFGRESIMVIVIFATIGFALWVFANGYILKLIGISFKKTIPVSLTVLLMGASIISLPRIVMFLI